MISDNAVVIAARGPTALRLGQQNRGQDISSIGGETPVPGRVVFPQQQVLHKPGVIAVS